MSRRGWFLTRRWSRRLVECQNAAQLEGQEFEFTWAFFFTLKLVLCCGRHGFVCDLVKKWCSC